MYCLTPQALLNTVLQTGRSPEVTRATTAVVGEKRLTIAQCSSALRLLAEECSPASSLAAVGVYRGGDPMTRTRRLAAMATCVLVSTATAMAEPQRGGGGGSGGGGGQRTAQPRDGGGQPVGPAQPGGPARQPGAGQPGPSGGGVYGGGAYYGNPYYPTRGSYVFVGGYFYDPFYGPYPWWPASAYGWGYYPVFDYRAEVRILATPREATVYVDGFYAGIVDDFDGTFQRLPLTPGGHRIELFLEGHRTVRKNLYLQPGSTTKLRETMDAARPGGGERAAPGGTRGAAPA